MRRLHAHREVERRRAAEVLRQIIALPLALLKSDDPPAPPPVPVTLSVQMSSDSLFAPVQPVVPPPPAGYEDGMEWMPGSEDPPIEMTPE